MRMDAAEDCTPVQISSEAFIANYGFRWQQVYQPFFAEWNIPYSMPKPVKVPESLDLLSQINAGKRKLDWCPGSVNIMSHLYPFFVSRGILFDCPDLHEDDLERIKAGEDAWLVSSAERLFSNEQEHREHVKQSGFYRKALEAPNMVHVLYLLALAEYRGIGYATKNIPFASSSVTDLRFVRTGTKIVDRFNRRLTICVSYVPMSAVIVKALTDEDLQESIYTMDAFILK